MKSEDSPPPSQAPRTALGRFVAGGPSPNPGGRPRGVKGFAAYARELTGDGRSLVEFWAKVVDGEVAAGMRERLHASELLASRAYGKAMDISASLDLGSDEGSEELKALASEALRSFANQLSGKDPRPGVTDQPSGKEVPPTKQPSAREA